ncbi:hypothetical protein [Novosphingobium sediminicola]|uniref:Uncharacterized protein n=1 Tax=Novosphingobium sediminicola TaxID=563162 RepID=A0A7W6G8Z4_9SPHN|nr:hypothetical protein [Novosphingobium sediminicola]MBB3957836.1 hypothetical protein [Novosphingobium sediminicola]
MREVEAFSYWPDHASAIQGFGGRRRSPDPRYCFHTMYNDVRPGPARYVLQLNGVKASHGELSLRVHAFRPPDDVQISLVAGSRLALEGREGDLSVEVRFVALRGVVYAFYGYFSEDTDIEAAHVHVQLHEYEGDDLDHVIDPPRSALAHDPQRADARPANALIHAGGASIHEPVSQDCTLTQLAALGWREMVEERSPAAVMRFWREQVSLAALPAYGVNLSGLDGVLAGPVSADMKTELGKQPFIIRQVEDPADFARAVSFDDFVDFLLWPEGPKTNADVQQRQAWVEGALNRLKIGGVAIIGLSYRFHNALVSSSAATDHRELSRNEIGQWAMRLIGKGFSVAPLYFAAEDDLVCDDDDFASFALIVQRQ